MLKFYGLKTCDTCRKARQWLDHEKITYSYIDVRADGVTKSDVTRLAKAIGWEKLLNKASTSWRALADAEKENLSEAKAIGLMVSNPTLIKRPVFEGDGLVMAGFRDEQKAALKALK